MNPKQNQDKPDDKERFKINVNGREKIAPKRELSFEDIVKLAFDNAVFDNPLIRYTVTYKTLDGKEGSLVKGDTIKVEKDMMFDVTKSDKS